MAHPSPLAPFAHLVVVQHAPRGLAPWVADPALVARWAVARQEVVPPCSGGVPLREALDALDEVRFSGAAEPSEEQGAAVAAARAGMCSADLAALACQVDRADADLAEIVLMVRIWFTALGEPYPQMDVRDALGWLLACADPEWARGSARQAPETVAAWAAVGLQDTGWLCVAAGFTPDEAAAGVEAGSLTEDDALALAALRGAALPAGVAARP